MAQLVKNPPAMWETWLRSLGWEDTLEKGKGNLSSILAWRMPWTVWSMKCSRLEYWSGPPFPSPGHLPNPGIEARSPAFQVDSLPGEPPGKPTVAAAMKLKDTCFLEEKLRPIYTAYFFLSRFKHDRNTQNSFFF